MSVKVPTRDFFIEQDLDASDDIIQTKEQSLSRCSPAMTSKATKLAATTFGFGLTTVIASVELAGSREIVPLSLTSLGNGIAIAAFGHLLVDPRFRKQISEFVAAWSYPAVLTTSQVYLNVVPDAQLKLYALFFLWGLGVFLGKDGLTIGSMQINDLPLANLPPQEDEILRTVGFNTRSDKPAAKAILVAHAVASIALTVFNFALFLPLYQELGDVGKLGIPQDLIAMYAGDTLGDITARLLDRKKEELELRHSQSLLKHTGVPTMLKALRIGKVVTWAATPFFVGMLFAIPATPNTPEDFVAKTAAGIFYGAVMLMLRREFENRRSYLHFRADEASVNEPLHTTKEKVRQFANKYLPTLIFFGALTGFMGWAAATNTLQVDAAIIVLLASTYASFIFTDRLAAHYRPEQNKRVLNELAFRFMYAPIGLSFPYQYLTTKVDIGDRQLKADSTALYVLSLVTWFIWGLNVNRAMDIQRKSPLALPLTPPIALQELGKTFVSNLSG